MKDFKAPDDHPTPALDFISLEGRAAIRASLAKHHPEFIETCMGFGPATEAELAAHAAHVAEIAAIPEPTEPEALDDFVLTDRYWHGMHRLTRPIKETT